DSRPDSRGPARDSRPDSRGPARDSRPDSRGPARDSRPDSRGPARDSRPDSFPRPERFSGHFSPPTECAPVFGTLNKDSQRLLSKFLDLSLDVLPLDSKKLQLLPDDIRALSHELTDDRSARRWGYMNDPATLSAYIRYYQWWNLVRLTRLFASLPLNLKDDDAAVDLGSGPLTLPIALWIARPDLRVKKLTWYCVDISSGALSAGEELFLRIAAETGVAPWTIIRIKGAMGVSLRKKAALVASANMFNEIFLEESGSIVDFAANQARDLASYAFDDASILVVEPGIPRAGNFISLIRRALIREGYAPSSPCPHSERCPFPGERNTKWCHFVFDTEDAPEPLKKLSAQANLTKERAALSFVFVEGKKIVKEEPVAEDVPSEENPVVLINSGAAGVAKIGESPLGMLSRMSDLFPPLRIRIISDPIRLPNYRTGRYGCSDLGMVLVTGSGRAGEYLQECHSGYCLELPRPNKKQLERDQKTGATLIPLDGWRSPESRPDSRGGSSRDDSSRGGSFRGGSSRDDNFRGGSSRGPNPRDGRGNRDDRGGNFRSGNPRGGSDR
ncbi:MAG TPA: hypothetical protein GXZ47_06010, partial [Treponema sp.]|nr:hypothetical protein [Treponema sp.]